MPKVLDELELDLKGLCSKENILDPSKEKEFKEDVKLFVCIPGLSSLFLVDQSGSVWFFYFDIEIVVSIAVVVFDEFPLLVLISLSNDWSHVDFDAPEDSANKKFGNMVNGCGWW